MSYRSFSADLSRFGVTVDKRCTAAIRQAALTALETVQGKMHPVDSGWSRGSWQLSVNSPGTGVYSYYSGGWVRGNKARGNKPPKGTGMPIPAQPRALPALRWSDKVYLSNNVPYIGIVERRAGMLAFTVRYTTRTLEKLANKLAK